MSAKKLDRRNRLWIGEITSLATKTVLVTAPSRKEAIRRLNSCPTDSVFVESVDVNYDERARRIVREQK